MQDQQQKTSCFVQAKLSDFSTEVSQEYGKPSQKFMKNMLFGLCGTGSPSIFNMSKLVQDNVSTKKTSDRLYRHLREDDWATEVEKIFLNLLAPQVTDDTIFIVDESDIEKPYATKMQGCALVHNGSKSERTNGYQLLNIVAMIPQIGGYRLLPSSCILYSDTHEIDTAKQLLQDRIVVQQLAFYNKGTYVFDRGYDDRKLIHFLKDNGVRFVIRGKGQRAIKEGLFEENFKKHVDLMNFKHELPGLKKDTKFRCATRKIRVRTDDHPSKESNTVEVDLVVARTYVNGKQRGHDFYLLCDFEDPKLSEIQIIAKAMDVYRKRWTIEEVHRQMKQSLKWESMRLASYGGLKNLNSLMALALYFIYSLKTYIHVLAVGFPKIIHYDKKDRCNLKEFIYYRIAEVVSLCLKHIVVHKRKSYRQSLIDSWQLEIRLF